jgi:HSP20 family protein
MAILRFEPFRDQFDQLRSMAASGTRAPLAMPIDVYRSADGSYHIEADLPGVNPDSVDVTVEHSTLTIRAERTPRYGESDHVTAAERPQGTFSRHLNLGDGVDADHLSAAYTDGVLHVTIPASPKVQPRRIKIAYGAGASVVGGSNRASSTKANPAKANPAKANPAKANPK